MPRFIADELNLTSEMKYTHVTLMLADRSTVKPQGVFEDVCVGVGKFNMPCDFMVLDIEAGDIPLIIGRSFMATGDAWVGVRDKIVAFQVNGERVIFNMDKTMKQPSELAQIQPIDHVEYCVKDMLDFLMHNANEHADSEEKDQGEVCELKAIRILEQDNMELKFQERSTAEVAADFNATISSYSDQAEGLRPMHALEVIATCQPNQAQQSEDDRKLKIQTELVSKQKC